MKQPSMNPTVSGQSKGKPNEQQPDGNPLPKKDSRFFSDAAAKAWSKTKAGK